MAHEGIGTALHTAFGQSTPSGSDIDIENRPSFRRAALLQQMGRSATASMQGVTR